MRKRGDSVYSILDSDQYYIHTAPALPHAVSLLPFPSCMLAFFVTAIVSSIFMA